MWEATTSTSLERLPLRERNSTDGSSDPIRDAIWSAWSIAVRIPNSTHLIGALFVAQETFAHSTTGSSYLDPPSVITATLFVNGVVVSAVSVVSVVSVVSGR